MQTASSVHHLRSMAQEASETRACLRRVAALRRSSSSVLDPLYIRPHAGRELTEGQVVEESAARARDGDPLPPRRRRVPAPDGGRPHRPLPAMVWDDVPDLTDWLRPGCAVHVRGPLSEHPRYGRQLKVQAHPPGRRGRVRPGRAARRPAALGRADGGRPGRARRHRAERRTCATCWTRSSSTTWDRFRDAPAAKRYHQAYRHGLLEHSLTVAQAVGLIAADLPGRGPRRRGHRRAAARHRQARGLHARAQRDRPHRRGPPPGRDRARLLPRAAHDRGPRGLPARPRPGRRAHHPQPPRPARARQPRRARAPARPRSST